MSGRHGLWGRLRSALTAPAPRVDAVADPVQRARDRWLLHGPRWH